MAGFTPSNPMGWAPKDPVTSKQLNHTDQQIVKAVNGVDGGAYDGPLELSDIELMPNGTGGIHGAGKIDTTGKITTTKAVTAGVVKGSRYQPEDTSSQAIDVSATPTCTLDLTAHDTFVVTLSDSNDFFNLAVLQALVFETASADPDREVKPGAKFTITFVSDQPGGMQLAANAWPPNVRFRSKTDRLLDGTDDKDLTTYELVNRGTAQAPIFDVLRVSRGTRT